MGIEGPPSPGKHPQFEIGVNHTANRLINSNSKIERNKRKSGFLLPPKTKIVNLEL